MIIDSSSLRFAGISTSREREERSVQAQAASSGPARGNVVDIRQISASRENVSLQVSQSSYLYARSQVNPSTPQGVIQVHSREEALQSLVSYAFSRNIRLAETVALGSSASTGRLTPQGQPVSTRASLSLSHAYRYEAEQQSALTIEGRLTLADSRSIDFVVHTRMDSSLQFQSGSGAFAQTAVRTDPLIINLHGGAAQLTDSAFRFDIDGDGNAEAVSFATGGSGFIAFDRNGDGTINDGTELFGSRSGDGFADLAAHDDDGNGFIDSNDSIFSQLKFYSRDESGKETLASLGAMGVAAIGLQKADSPALLRGSAGQELGSVRSTGIYVTESGQVGTVQQVDLASRDLGLEADFSADFHSAQIAPPAESDGVSPERSELENVLQRLQQMHGEFIARLDAMQQADSEPGGKTMLEMLVDKLEEFIHNRDGKDTNDDS